MGLIIRQSGSFNLGKNSVKGFILISLFIVLNTFTATAAADSGVLKNSRGCDWSTECDSDEYCDSGKCVNFGDGVGLAVGVVIGVSIGIPVIIAIIISLSCVYCPCCLCYRRRHRNMVPPSQFVMHQQGQGQGLQQGFTNMAYDQQGRPVYIVPAQAHVNQNAFGAPIHSSQQQTPHPPTQYQAHVGAPPPLAATAPPLTPL